MVWIFSVIIVQSAASSNWYPYDATAWATTVSGSNARCQVGSEQSPISIPICSHPEERSVPITLSYGTKAVTLENNGHTVELTPNDVAANSAAAGTMTAPPAGQSNTFTYNLKQCHWHWGSEHRIGHVQQPLEVHCVHQRTPEATSGRYGVLGIFYRIGQPNQFLSQIENSLPPLPSPPPTPPPTLQNIDMTLLAHGIQLNKFWSYLGSLTTPGCDEAVDWFVAMQRSTLTMEQLSKMKAAVGWVSEKGNFRPPQNINARVVYGCQSHWYPYSDDAWSHYVPNAAHTCESGTQQSPIDLPLCEEKNTRPAIVTTWATQNVKLFNNMHTVQLDARGSPKGGMTIQYAAYTLAQCHFHVGSEHQVASVQLRMEAHCVHSKDGVSGRYGVFGVLFSIGSSSNTFLGQFEDQLPIRSTIRRLGKLDPNRDLNVFGDPVVTDQNVQRRLTGQEVASTYTGPVDFKLLHHNLSMEAYWSYSGSLTTPSCTEVVDWYVLMDKAQLTQTQLDKFTTAIGWNPEGGNYRPPQPLSGRSVSGCVSVRRYPYSQSAWSSSNPACSQNAQSPINFPTCSSPRDRGTISITWATQAVTLINNGHTIQLTVGNATNSGDMVANTETYNLLQCHFHVGSEHTVNHVQHVMEAHCVHSREGSMRMGVLGVFFEIGTANAFLSEFDDQLPPNPSRRQLNEASAVDLNLYGDVPVTDRRLTAATTSAFAGPLQFTKLVAGLSMKDYWSYSGSLTTPPCTEAVDWYVLMNTAHLTNAQLDKFTTIMRRGGAGNYRPPQKLNTRVLDGCKTPWYPADNSNWAHYVHNAATACYTGQKQSPVDLGICAMTQTRTAITTTWTNQPVVLLNNGHTIQLTAQGNQGAKGKMTADGRQYTLSQCHFHAGSEHVIGGVQQDMECHCVHEKDGATGHYGVFGVFFAVGQTSNTFLSALPSDSNLPAQPTRRLIEEPAEVPLDIWGNPASDSQRRQLSTDRISSWTGPVDFQLLHQGLNLNQYWSYDGSLTTPGCSEVVDWFIVMQKAIMTATQRDLFKTKLLGSPSGTGNFRPPQPLHGRTVSGCVSWALWYPYNQSYWSSKVSGNSATCASGTKQSPIDFTPCSTPSSRTAIQLSYATQKVRIENNGHTIKIYPEGSRGTMKSERGTYVIVECHFHGGSEHTVGGIQAALEVHCVHEKQNDATKYGVLGMFYDVGAQNAFLASIDQVLPSQPNRQMRRLTPDHIDVDMFGDPVLQDSERRLTGTQSSFKGPLDLTTVYAGVDKAKYWTYDGSLTTPPCTEAVDWHVLMTRASLTQAQLDRIEKAIGWTSAYGNFRPPQQLNTRTVAGCDTSCPGTGTSWYPYDADTWACRAPGSNAICKTGQKQSPVDLPACSSSRQSPAIQVAWGRPKNVLLINNGHSVQLDIKTQTDNTMTAAGVTYTLLQCHYHVKSEHFINGVQQEMEMHCVHQHSDPTKFGVLSILFEVGPPDPFLGTFEDMLPNKPARRLVETQEAGMAFYEGGNARRLSGLTTSAFTGPLDFGKLIQSSNLRNYWSYQGSFTTPGCDEVVDWFVLMQKSTLSSAQLNKMTNAIGWSSQGGNFRTPQPLHGRKVAGCPELAAASATHPIVNLGTPAAIVSICALWLSLSL